MSVGEQERHDLHDRFVSVLGRKEAAIMMSLLPPVGWADVATRHDLHELEARLEAGLAAKITSSQNRIILAMMGTMLATVIAVSGLAFAAAGLT